MEGYTGNTGKIDSAELKRRIGIADGYGKFVAGNMNAARLFAKSFEATAATGDSKAKARVEGYKKVIDDMREVIKLLDVYKKELKAGAAPEDKLNDELRKACEQTREDVKRVGLPAIAEAYGRLPRDLKIVKET